MDGTDKLPMSVLVEKIGSPLALIEHGIWQKPYPCCASTHRPIDALLFLLKKNQFEVHNVLQIESQMAEHYARNLMYENPQNPMEAKFSLQYCLSAALLGKMIGPKDFTYEAINRNEIKELLPKIRIKSEPVNDGQSTIRDAAITTVILKNGEKFSKKIDFSLGQPQNPLSESYLAKKFIECTQVCKYDEKYATSLFMNLNNIGSFGNILAWFLDVSSGFQQICNWCREQVNH